MRAGIATVQQTLTPEAAAVLKRAIVDAQRRGHAQVTPLHVASSLLASPSSMLQQACIQSHRHVPHPLHCRALELCFNVALERLPATIIQQQQQQQQTSQVSSKSQSPQAAAPSEQGSPSSCSSGATLSNALVAALKRAQAHQRRGCPEQQQVPLLAVKVEMEQLVISILDDPSVSRVMREAGFSSTRAKNSLEAVCSSSSGASSSSPLIANRPAGSSSLQQITPEEIRARLQQNHQHQALLLNHGNAATIDAALGILSRSKKQRNPVLIGEDASTGPAARDLLSRLEQQQQRIELPDCFKNGLRVLGVERGFGSSKEISDKSLLEITRAQERCLQDQIPVVVFLGNLAWCAEPLGGAMLGELAAVLARCERLWYVAIANSSSYMRFLAQFPTMESSLGLQPLPVPSSSVLSSIRPRFSLVEKPLEQSGAFPRLPKMPFKLPEDPNWDEQQQQLSCCPDCTAKFEQESLLLLQEQQQGFSKTESVQSNSGESLPFWMKNRKAEPRTTQQQAQDYPQLMRELRRKWSRNCQNSHPVSSRRSSPPSSSLPNLIDSHSSSSQTSSPDAAPLKSAPSPSPSSLVNGVNASRSSSASWLSLSTLTEEALNPPSLALGLTVERNPSRVATELVLATPNLSEKSALKVHRERIEAANGCSQRAVISGRSCSNSVVDLGGLFKTIYRRVCDRVPWQGEQIAGKIASAVVQCRSGEKRRGASARGDAWMVFSGGDFMAKRKVAKVLAEAVFEDEDKLVLVSLKNSRADHGRTNKMGRRSPWEDQNGFGFRGKTVVDRIADAVKLKPFSVVLLEDFDQADVSVKKALVRTMERGRIQHSSGREVSVSNAIVILTTAAAAGKNKSRVEEKLGAVEGGEILVRMGSRSTDREFGRNRCEVRILDAESVLACEEVCPVAGEKRKDRTNWTEKLESLLGFNSRKKNIGLDLNLGLGSVWEEDEPQACGGGGGGGGGNVTGLSESEESIFDEVVSFNELELDCVARPVMEGLEGLATRFGGCVEVDVKAVELMLAKVWEEPNGREKLQRWLKESVEAKILGGDFVLVRLVGGGGGGDESAIAGVEEDRGGAAEVRIVPEEQASSMNKTSLTLFGGIEVGS